MGTFFLSSSGETLEGSWVNGHLKTTEGLKIINKKGVFLYKS